MNKHFQSLLVMVFVVMATVLPSTEALAYYRCQFCYQGNCFENPDSASEGQNMHYSCAPLQTDCHDGTMAPCAVHCHLSMLCPAPIDPGSPVAIRVNGTGPWTFSNAANGAWFDLDGDGDKELVPWLEGNVAFLAQDKNRNSQIDNVSELYGSYVPSNAKPGTEFNGFDYLRFDDLSGDGFLSSDDPVWPALFLWHDVNRDALLQPEERISLDSVGIQMIDTEPVQTSRRDPDGNLFKYKGKLWRNGHTESFYDVYLPE